MAESPEHADADGRPGRVPDAAAADDGTSAAAAAGTTAAAATTAGSGPGPGPGPGPGSGSGPAPAPAPVQLPTPQPAPAPAPVQLPTPQPATAPSPPVAEDTGAQAKDPYEYAGTTDDDDTAASGPERGASPPLAADIGDPPGPPTAAVAKVAGSTVVIDNAGAAQKSKPRETAAKRKQPEPDANKIYNYDRFTLMTRVSSKSGPKNQRLVSDIGPNPKEQFVHESEGSGRKPTEKTFRGPSMFQTRIKSLKEVGPPARHGLPAARRS